MSIYKARKKASTLIQRAQIAWRSEEVVQTQNNTLNKQQKRTEQTKQNNTHTKAHTQTKFKY